MARYYFHFKSGDTVETDEEGLELADLSAVAREADLSARELMADAIKARKPNVPEALVITDELRHGSIFAPNRRRASKDP